MPSPTLFVAEPRASYNQRPPLVVDASIVAAALFGERSQAEAAGLLHIRMLHAPCLLDSELANVGLKKLRREELAVAAIRSALQAYTRLGIERHAVDAAEVFALAQRYGLTAYDAAYLWVAEQVGASLATFDQRLARAAREHLAGGDRVHDAD